MQSRRKDDPRDEPIVSSRDDENVRIDLDEHPLTADRAEQYQDWAQRMRAKRETNQQRIRDREGGHAAATPSYWRTEDVYRESTRLAAGEVPASSDPLVQELLGVFGLTGEPASHLIDTAFRRLAKEHHPDRHVDDDEPTRAYHLDQMRRVNEAYARLRQLDLT